jgi:hypothetical protein
MPSSVSLLGAPAFGNWVSLGLLGGHSRSPGASFLFSLNDPAALLRRVVTVVRSAFRGVAGGICAVCNNGCYWYLPLSSCGKAIESLRLFLDDCF